MLTYYQTQSFPFIDLSQLDWQILVIYVVCIWVKTGYKKTSLIGLLLILLRLTAKIISFNQSGFFFFYK